MKTSTIAILIAVILILSVGVLAVSNSFSKKVIVESNKPLEQSSQETYELTAEDNQIVEQLVQEHVREFEYAEVTPQPNFDTELKMPITQQELRNG